MVATNVFVICLVLSFMVGLWAGVTALVAFAVKQGKKEKKDESKNL